MIIVKCEKKLRGKEGSSTLSREIGLQSFGPNLPVLVIRADEHSNSVYVND